MFDPQEATKPRSSRQHQGLLRICELYASVQGEGLLTGMPSTFVRTSGCNLRCWFCDTPFASWKPEGDYYAPGEIVEQCQRLGIQHVVLTGGEPMLFGAITELTRQLLAAGFHLTIETAGTMWREVYCDLMSISPKLPSSAPRQASDTWIAAHHARRQRLDVVRKMMERFEYQLKFVVDCPSDAEEVLDYLHQLGRFDRHRVLMMPQGTSQAELDRQAQWLLPWCQEHGVRFCPRAHIAWFGNRRQT
ncbi:MAG: 7-carboxy-7-deazaguanine synthase [Pirellulaceae bacterium]|nr:MAG: 7-carboxy-7-deazaguanine synthase [Pirellulaceae bacterium]